MHELFDLKREDSESCDLIYRGLGDEVHLTHGAPSPRRQQGTEPSEAEAGDEKVQSSSAEFGRQGTARHLEVEVRSGNFPGTVC